MVNLTETHNIEQQTDSLADYMPSGYVFEAKKVPDTNLRKLLEGFAGLLVDAEEKINLVASEYDITTTTEFIEEWEGFVGIPSDCFLVADTLEQRRKNVLIKLTALGVQTKEEFEALGVLLGITITVSPVAEYAVFPMTFPIIFFDSAKAARFTMLVEYECEGNCAFPYIFPLEFDSQLVETMKCIIRKLTPANVALMFRRTGESFADYMAAKDLEVWYRLGESSGTTAVDDS